MNTKEIKDVYALEPGKIYCLQVDIGTVNCDWLEAIVKGFKLLDITIVVIDKGMNFVPMPEGYEITKVIKH